MDVHVIYDGSIGSINTIKTNLLYFDKVEVFSPGMLRGHIPLFDGTHTNFLYYLDTLDSVKVYLTPVEILVSKLKNRANDILNAISKALEKTTNGEGFLYHYVPDIFFGGAVGGDDKELDALDEIFYKNPIRKRTGWPGEYANTIFDEYADDFHYKIMGLFLLVANMENLLNFNLSVLSGNPFMDSVLRELGSKIHENSETYHAVNKSIEFFIPDLSSLNFDDILKIRHKCRDELIAMRHYISSLSLTYNPQDFQSVENLVARQVQPALAEFQAKMKGIRLSGARTVLSALGSIAPWPLMATFVPDLASNPVALGAGIGASLALSAAGVGFDIASKKSELEGHPLYFTKKLTKTVEKVS